MTATRSKTPYGGFAALIAAGCATATAGEDPGFLLPDGYAGAPAAAPMSSGADSGTGPTAGVGGASARGGRGSTSAGRTGNVGSGGTVTMSAGGMSTSTGACPNARMPATPGAANGNSGSFDTAGEVCYFVEGTFNQWACSNLGGRTVTINGMPAMCGGALPAPVDGGYYFDFGASSDGTNYTSFYWYTS